MSHMPASHEPPSPQPALNVPRAVWLIISACVLVHAVRLFVISDSLDAVIVFLFGFTPSIWGDVQGTDVFDNLVSIKKLVSPFSHAFLHGGWGHLASNAMWLLVFGSPLAYRIGGTRFVVFFLLGAAGGVLAFYIVHPNSLTTLVGASGAVSALMASAVRFGFRVGAQTSSSALRQGYAGPLRSTRDSLADPTGLSFVIITFLINAAIGLDAATLDVGLPGSSGTRIAWEAHIGGFIAGWLLIPLFVSKNQAH